MYCKNCGKETDDNAYVCVHCGIRVENNVVQTATDGESKTGLGVVMALFLGLIGLIIGLCMYKSDSYERQTFVKGWGITFAISAVISIILYFTVFASLFGALGSLGYL